MSKNFEEEYRQMIDSELPDLWDRIEVQLPKAAAAAETVAEATEAAEVSEAVKALGATEVSEAAEAPVSGTVKNEKAVTVGRRRLFYKRWMPAVVTGAAAILFVIAVVPMLILSKGNKSGMMNEAAGFAADGATGGTGGDCVAMDVGDDPSMYCEPENEYYNEEAASETAAPTMEEEGKSTGDDCAEGAAEVPMSQDAAWNSPELTSERDNQSGAGAEPEAEESDSEEMNSAEIPDLYQAEVQILGRMLTEEGEIYYEAVVLQDGDDGFQKGMRVYFRCAGEGEAQRDGADASFRRGEKYLLSLYASDETLESYEIETGDKELYAEEMYIVYEFILKK